MDYRVFSTYYQLSLQGKVPELLCKNNIDHPTLIPSLIEDEKIILSCIYPDCKYNAVAGSDLYKHLEYYLNRLNIVAE
jgi:hypothetical protein